MTMSNWIVVMRDFLSRLFLKETNKDDNSEYKEDIEKPADNRTDKRKIIRVAVCPCRPIYRKNIVTALKYSWSNKENYRFDVKDLELGEIVATNLEIYDVLVVPGCNFPFFAGSSEHWKKNIRKFVEDGGGYVGICGGALAATQGFKIADTNKKRKINEDRKKRVNEAVLKIVNLYANCDADEEMQYDVKEPPGIDLTGIPLTINIKNFNHPILKDFSEKKRRLQWHSGPGFYLADSNDNKMGEIDVLAIFDDKDGEPSIVAPIHKWEWRKRKGWVSTQKIETDIGGQYAIVASSYGKGRIVLFSSHPENRAWKNGGVKELPNKKGGIYWWKGRKTKRSYNWWILRRAVAWTAHVQVEDLPPLV